MKDVSDTPGLTHDIMASCWVPMPRRGVSETRHVDGALHKHKVL